MNQNQIAQEDAKEFAKELNRGILQYIDINALKTVPPEFHERSADLYGTPNCAIPAVLFYHNGEERIFTEKRPYREWPYSDSAPIAGYKTEVLEKFVLDHVKVYLLPLHTMELSKKGKEFYESERKWTLDKPKNITWEDEGGLLYQRWKTCKFDNLAELLELFNTPLEEKLFDGRVLEGKVTGRMPHCGLRDNRLLFSGFKDSDGRGFTFDKIRLFDVEEYLNLEKRWTSPD